MVREIAVFVGEDGETASLFKRGRIVVYRKDKGKWVVVKEKDFFLDRSLSIKGLREKMLDALDFLGDCRVFVGLSVSGVPYFELKKARYSIWEFPGKPGEFLDCITAREKKDRAEAVRENAGSRFTPLEIDAGSFRISLVEIQEGNAGVSSKQVLLPFLRRGQFNSLEIICSHMPTWLEGELIGGNLCSQIQETDERKVKVTLLRSKE